MLFRSRCAIYNRKSSEEGLDQEFNSLDAQREACAAYIASQKPEGWVPVADRYDDGGFSGGTLERPALKRLLADIEAFFKLLPREVAGRPLRHAIEPRHASFKDERFYELARNHNAAIVFADDDDFPAIDEPTADFTYARLQRSQDDVASGYPAAELGRWVKQAKTWAKRGNAFVYFISGAKVRNPAAAQALIERLG